VRARASRSGLALAVAALVATAVPGPVPPAGAAGRVAKITIGGFMFAPMTLRVAPGERVRVINRDAVAHTLSALDGKFTTGPIRDNASVTFRAPTRPGTYRFDCAIHPFMIGDLIVR
jgi:plastocyanin